MLQRGYEAGYCRNYSIVVVFKCDHSVHTRFYSVVLFHSIDAHQIFGFVDVGKGKEIRVNDF